jgi:hypothetical protein
MGPGGGGDVGYIYIYIYVYVGKQATLVTKENIKGEEDKVE